MGTHADGDSAAVKVRKRVNGGHRLLSLVLPRS